MRRSYSRQQQRRGWADNRRENRDSREPVEQWGAQVDGGDAQVDWRNVNRKLDDIQTDVQDLALKMQALMTRAEIEAALDRRVSLERYTSDMNDISSRLTRQETGWTRMLPWISLLVSVTGSILIPLLLAIIYGIVYLAQHP